MKKQLSRSVWDPSVWAILVTVGLFVFGSARPARADDDDGEKSLYIWAGHVDHSIPDFLAVIDFDEDSPGYGKVINVCLSPVLARPSTSPTTCTCRPTRRSSDAAGS